MIEQFGLRIADAHNLKLEYAELQIKEFQAIMKASSHDERTKSARKIQNADPLMEKVNKLARTLRAVFIKVVKQEIMVAQMQVPWCCIHCEDPPLCRFGRNRWLPHRCRQSFASQRRTCGYTCNAMP